MTTPTEEIRQASSDSLRAQLLQERYLLKDGEGDLAETPRQMLLRVAKAVARAEARYGAGPAEIRGIARRFYRLMGRGLFLPNSPTLMNAGRPRGLLCACFVLGMTDSLQGIFGAVRRAALVQGAGGGTGFDFDALRPAGDLIASTGGRTVGPVGFWHVISRASEAITRGAHRRAANMGMMSVWHPDILAFLAAKQVPGALANFNISVKVTDAFMQTLQRDPDSPHVVVNPRTGRRYLLPLSLEPGSYDLRNLVPAGTRDVGGCYRAGDIWQRIVDCAHATGEPGICFIDRVDRDNPTPALGAIRATNPCGEQPLLDEEACCLGSIDVSKFVRYARRAVDWEALGRVASQAVRFLDDVLDVTYFPVASIREVSLGNRKVGLGVMGLADALVKMGLRYDSQEAIDFTRGLAGFIREAAHRASEGLAGQRGRFANWPGSRWDTDSGRPMRNATCMTIAPTGSISILAGCSGGIEPIYSLAYRRRALDGREFIQIHPLLARLGRRGRWLSSEVNRKLFAGEPVVRIPGIPAGLAETLVTAHEVDPQWHVRMQAAFQENVDNAVSKTVNLRADAAASDVDKVFRLAFELGCKGITVYRDGSRAGQTFSASASRSVSGAADAGQDPRISPRPRRRVTAGKTSKFRMGCGTLFVTVNRDEHGMCEVFANLGKAGGCPSQSEATCRAVSAALRSGVEPRHLIEQLRGIRCLSAVRAKQNGDGVDVLSCPDAIAQALEEAVGMAPAPEAQTAEAARLCPDCGLPLRRESRCLVCSCGYSKCG